MACKYGQLECAKVLIAAGAVIHARTTTGISPLHLAVTPGHIQCVALLLATGAKVDVCLSLHVSDAENDY